MPNELIGQGDVVSGHYSKTERMTQIMLFLKDGKIRSTSEIARALKMKPTSNFRKILLAMWRDELILSYQDSGMYRWQIPAKIQTEMFPGSE